MNYSLVCGLAALVVGGCVNENPLYVDPTGESSSTSVDPTATASESSTSAPTTDGSTGDPESTGDNTVGTSVSTSNATSEGTTSDGTSGAVTMSTGDDTGGNTTMPAAFCGDGVLNPGEVCDDGDDDDTNGCTVACLPTPKIEDFIPAGSSEILGYEGKGGKFGLCPGILSGISLAGDPELGILRAKLLCKEANLLPLGEGEFLIQPIGEVLYGPYVGSEAEALDSWAPQCPEEAPILLGFGGEGDGNQLTSVEIHCVNLVIVPNGDYYELVPEGLVEKYAGYEGGAELSDISCGIFPGTFTEEVIIHHFELGVSGMEVLCSEVDFGF